MTTAKKSIRAPTTELDLDSLLRSHGGNLSSSDDDDDSAAFLHRTVDEILNDSDSSSSDSSPSPPQPSIQQNPSQKDESPSQTLEKDHEERSSSIWRRSRSQGLLSSSSNGSLSSLGFRANASSSSALPPLFGSVRPNPKPGAALAAAAAASRSIPTPHAAAIKNRRAGSMESIQKVESAADLRETGDLSVIIATTSVNSEAEEEISGPISQSTTSSSSVEGEAAVISEEVATEEASFVEEIESSKSVEAKEEDNLVDLDSLDSTFATIDENSQQVDGALPLQDELVSIADEGDGIRDQELRREETIGERGYDSGAESAGGGELGGRVVEEGDMGDEIDKLVEERLEKLENSKNAEKKRRASMKPLEWAEELEKRHASYGLHWEEGAAAQPMRLEGIRRGPPAVGYLQIDLDNAVTRTISSQTFKRDCGSPEVVAVHFNFIAMGTSKGVVLVFPSKYSAQSVDRMDTKVSFSLPGSYCE